ERRLAGVGVTDERDRDVRDLGTLLAVQLTGPLDLGEAGAQPQQALAHPPTGDLELSFAGATRAGATPEPREMRPRARQARQEVVELRQLDLQLALEAAGAGGEDVEDQLAAVEHLDVEALGEGALLAWAQVLVDDHHRGAMLTHGLLELLDLALADEGGRT